MLPNIVAMHVNCRNAVYLHSAIRRFAVPDPLVSWSQPYAGYAPPYYDAPAVLGGAAWADPSVFTNQPLWNGIDRKYGVDRRSHASVYELDEASGLPRNPVGRTGLCGRGLLGRWGPNHAADPIITRWARCDDGDDDKVEGNTDAVSSADKSDRSVSRPVRRHPFTGLPVLQMVAIQRRDTGQWAIPGGMVDQGENVAQTLRREFAEEALSNAGPEALRRVEAFLAAGTERRIYAGYVDDPRNTDCAWMETVACWFHDADGEAMAGVRLEAGDDAGAVRWMDVGREIELYASHAQMVARVAELAEAHW